MERVVQRLLIAVFLALAVLTATAPVAAAIYKCEGPDGRTLYQQIPCPDEMDGGKIRVEDNGAVTDSEDATHLDAENPLLEAHRQRMERKRQARAAQRERLAAMNRARERRDAIRKARVRDELVIGMTRDDVEAVLGEPSAVRQRKGPSGVTEQWIYEGPDSNARVSFEDGRVSGFSR